jgi:hypothetical protein
MECYNNLILSIKKYDDVLDKINTDRNLIAIPIYKDNSINKYDSSNTYSASYNITSQIPYYYRVISVKK